jgi:heme-degrading monooxygenase HmoA
MQVKALIRRTLVKEKEKELFSLIQQLRSRAARHKGYISSEIVWNVEDLKESVSITTWRDLNAWKKWLEDEVQKELQKKIDALGCVTRYEIYAFPEFEGDVPMPML